MPSKSFKNRFHFLKAASRNDRLPSRNVSPTSRNVNRLQQISTKIEAFLKLFAVKKKKKCYINDIKI
jgi:hypothetical protein